MKYETFGAFLLAVAVPIMAAPTQPEPAVEDAVRAIVQQANVEARMVLPNPGAWPPRLGRPVRPITWSGPAKFQPLAAAVSRRDVSGSDDDLAAGEDDEAALLERRKFGRKTNAINAIANLAGQVLPFLGQRDLGGLAEAGGDGEAHLERRKFGRKTNAINAIANLAGQVLPFLGQRDLDGLAEAGGDGEAHLERRKFGRKTNAINAIANLAGQVLPFLGQRDLSGVEGAAGLEAREEPVLSEAEVRDTIASVFDQYEQANQKRDLDSLERRKFGRKTNAINAIANLAGQVLPFLGQRDLDGLAEAGGDEAHLERRKFGRKTNAINAIANLAGQVLPWLGIGQRDLSGVEGAAGLEARDEPVLSEAEVRDTIASVFDQYEQQQQGGSPQKRDLDSLERRKFGSKTNAINAIANLAGQVLPWLGIGQRDLSGIQARDEPVLSEAEIRDTIASVVDQYEQQQTGGPEKRDLDSLERRKFGSKTNAINAIANLAGQVLPWLGIGQRDLSGIQARDEPVLSEAEIRDTIASVVDQYEAAQQ
ncbi:hypothetical protein RB601_000636 [Gaeumannomyces tritici]